MFDVFPRALASVASVLFPIFASYKALKTADPAQLTPWLMYWVVLACVGLAESWVGWLLVWVPFYHYARLGFLLYLVLPQTQGARVLYQTHVHPWMEAHETRIDDGIASAHEQLRSVGLAYLRRAVAYVRAAAGLPPAEEDRPTAAAAAAAPASSQTYIQTLLARFSLPGGGSPAGGPPVAPVGGTTDMYGLLSAAMGTLGAGAVAAGTPSAASSPDRASFVATQRDRLRTLLSALDREAAQLEVRGEAAAAGDDNSSDTTALSRPPSGASGLSKSRSEADFEKIDAESGAEEERSGAGQPRRRGTATRTASGSNGQSSAGGGSGGSGSWMAWGWGRAADGTTADKAADQAIDKGKSSGLEG